LFASLSSAKETLPSSQPTVPDRHVSQFGRSAVSPSRPTLSQSAVRSGRQGKRAAARSHAQPPLCGEHGEHGEHWTLMAAAHGATLDQAGCVRTSASASHNPYSAPGSGTGKTINFRDQKPIGKRDPAQYIRLPGYRSFLGLDACAVVHHRRSRLAPLQSHGDHLGIRHGAGS
jgi:hypothetical protein